MYHLTVDGGSIAGYFGNPGTRPRMSRRCFAEARGYVPKPLR